MGSIGPELPSYIPTKRKHDQEGTGISTKPKKEALSHSSSPESVGKRRRVIGPALPPAPLDERPPHQSEDSSSDEDYGPTLPQNNHNDAARTPAVPTFDTANIAEPEKTQRDEWMMIPPKQDDLSARMDPTQIRARKFNTGKAAKVVSQKGGDNTVWTETPEQKRKRLDDQVLGNTQSAVTDTDAAMQRNHRVENDERARRIREHNEKHRGKSLYDQHQGSSKKEKEDAPSERSFDYEKDMGGGLNIGHAQKKEMLHRAADFGSRFSGGNFL